jgi:Holliday junction resolvasome RuvABC endonuclease subunit
MSNDILAFDISSVSIGWVRWDADRERVENHGLINLKLYGASPKHRLLRARAEVEYLIAPRTAAQLAYEGPAYKAHPGALIAQQRVVGVVLACAYLFGYEPIEISPATAKKALTGNGKADKAQMQALAQHHFDHTAYSEHEADALAVALAVPAVALLERGAS